MAQDKRPTVAVNDIDGHLEASCLYALMTDGRPVSRRNRASWYLMQVNKMTKCDKDHQHGAFEPNTEFTSDRLDDSNQTPSPKQDCNAAQPTRDISLVSITCDNLTAIERESLTLCDLPSTADEQRTSSSGDDDDEPKQFLVTPNSRALFLSKSIASSLILDLSPSVVSVSPQNDCIFLDSMFDAIKRVVNLLVKSLEIPSSSPGRKFVLKSKVLLTVIAYTPFVAAKNNQVLIQNRRISTENIDQVFVEIWLCLSKLVKEIQDLVSGTCGMPMDFVRTRTGGNVFVSPQYSCGGLMRHPGEVLEDIFELGLFSSSLMPRLSRLSLVIISDGLFSSTNNLNIFRLKSIAVSFVSLSSDIINPDSCFGYIPYTDLMKFIAKTTFGVYLSHQDLKSFSQQLALSTQIPLLSNPLYKLFYWSLHSETNYDLNGFSPKVSNLYNFDLSSNPSEVNPEHVARFFSVDQPINKPIPASFEDSKSSSYSRYHNHHDWRSFKQLERNLDVDFEQVLACLLREGYLIKSIQFKLKETTRIVARLILHWRHNLDLELELAAPYWNDSGSFDINDSNQLMIKPFTGPIYGNTSCEVIVHGSYSFLHNLYCDRRTKKRSEYRDIAYRQYRQLIDGVLHTHERLQYLSRFYREPSLSKVPSFLLHGNSLLYEQPHTHKLTSTIENVMDEAKTNEFQEYWQKISCLDQKSWKNLMHIHTLRLILEHDQPKLKNIHYQNTHGRYTNVQCRRALTAISNFIKSYASFALLEDTTYIKFIYNKEDDLREIETSATKGFIVIRINKLLPIIVVYLMFTSGILDSQRAEIVSYLENQLVNCKMRNFRTSTVQIENVLKSKTISSSSESCCKLIKSPLERMLKVYSRNFISDFLVHNWSHGLPGSYPFSNQQSIKVNSSNGDNSNSGPTKQHRSEQIRDYESDGSTNRYNLVFGKYLYGIRVVQTISDLPNEIVPSLAANVISKISTILVNIRIKQGFHIAFNNSGILNMVVELKMHDCSNDYHSSDCLCQYIVFPPTATNCLQNVHTVLNINGPTQATNNQSSNNTNNSISISKSASENPTSGSLGKSDGFLKNKPQETDILGNGCNGEIKMIKEYWIEQQYGISSKSDGYHRSLNNMRYSEIVDHLYLTDVSIFECLLTYDLLQLLCDKSSLYYDLDSSLSKADTKVNPIFSPKMSTSSSNILEAELTPEPCLPSKLIEGTSKRGTSKVPLIELDYKFSVTKFLDHCQQACLSVLLFRDHSEFYESKSDDADKSEQSKMKPRFNEIQQQFGADYQHSHHHSHHHQTSSSLTATTTLGGLNPTKTLQSRKMSVGVHDLDTEHSKREHRFSYQYDHITSSTYMNPIYSQSLNHIFLETLHKRLKQMHDKELKLSDRDRDLLPFYLKKREQQVAEFYRRLSPDFMSETSDFDVRRSTNNPSNGVLFELDDTDEQSSEKKELCDESQMQWRCFLRKGNQDNLMIILIPATLGDITKWHKLSFGAEVNILEDHYTPHIVCPLFVFRCSSTMVNDNVMSFLKQDSTVRPKPPIETDLSLHFGQPCRYNNKLYTCNDELNADILPLTALGVLNPSNSDEKTLEVVHFRAFLRKVKNTVLKSRFSSLNDAYISELFIHKADILYYMTNVDTEIQKKYHVTAQLKGLSDFIKNYEEYNESLPKEPGKVCNQLLNSILLQKCGLFINQPIARFNESDPLIKQLHDKKLIFLMRCNYKIELPLMEDNLAESALLKSFIKTSSSYGNYDNSSGISSGNQINSYPSNSTSSIYDGVSGNSTTSMTQNINSHSTTIKANAGTASSLSKNEGSRLAEMKCSSVGACGSPTSTLMFLDRSKTSQVPRFGSNSTINSISCPASDNTLILDAFRGSKCCSIKDIPDKKYLESSPVSSTGDNYIISSRHEAHMAEVLKRTSERKESHHYRRVLKSKANYNQSHSAIDQALKRVDSLGRLEHFCLTPLLFCPTWRSRLAPVRDHTIESSNHNHRSSHLSDYHYENSISYFKESKLDELISSGSGSNDNRGLDLAQIESQKEADDRWHQIVCNNYIREYEQYIQTLGFNSVQIRYQPNVLVKSGASPAPGQQQSASSSGKTASAINNLKKTQENSRGVVNANLSTNIPRDSLTSTSNANLSTISNPSSSSYNTGYLVKFLNSGCLVFKVGFCKPYVYSILYSIEGERFNNSNIKLSMTTFLDELDNIKLTMHLHSFTYDYHLRSMYSYVSGRQLSAFSPGYHLISFLDDFRKYYQKAPNYARNHILCGEVTLNNLKVSGQQLYNYIITHNSAYNMEVVEMSSSNPNLPSPNQRNFMANDSQQPILETLINLRKSMNNANGDRGDTTTRSHANDFVLIELKREKIRYRDGKDPDVYDSGLLITHDSHVNSNMSGKNSITLKYFLLLTNQRDLYPKLIHTYDNIMSFGCHRPIRLGIAQIQARQPSVGNKKTQTNSAIGSAQSDVDELQSSCDISGPTSILSTCSSAHSSNSGGLQFGGGLGDKLSATTNSGALILLDSMSSTSSLLVPKIEIQSGSSETGDGGSGSDEVNRSYRRRQLKSDTENDTDDSVTRERTPINQQSQSIVEKGHPETEDLDVIANRDVDVSVDALEIQPSTREYKRNSSSGSDNNGKKNSQQTNNDNQRTICDEEITYLGYFSSDEMDMLKFLQEKTSNLRGHIEKVVQLAEIHYRRDYLWQKLMQRKVSTSGASSKSSDYDIPLTTDELLQLLAIVEAIELSSLDSQLAMFTTMHINWNMKLLKAFNDLRQSSSNQHRIYTVKTTKILLLYTDPECTSALILMTVDSERASIEMNFVFKDKQECMKIPEKSPGKSAASGSGDQPGANLSPSGQPTPIELEKDCQQLINDFVNFCATFMWSTLLA